MPDRPPLDYPAGLEIASDRGLSYTARSVYNHLAATIGFERFEMVKVSKISRCLGCDDGTVSLALRTLAERGYIEIGPFTFRLTRSYRLVRERVTPAA